MTDHFEYEADRIAARKEATQRESASATVDSQTVKTALNAWNAAVASTPAPQSESEPVDFAALRVGLFADVNPTLYAEASAEAAKKHSHEKQAAVTFISEWLTGFAEGYNESFARGEELERQRIAEIFALPEAEGREPLMEKLAFTTNLTPETIQTILGTTPKQGAVRSEFAEHLARMEAAAGNKVWTDDLGVLRKAAISKLKG